MFKGSRVTWLAGWAMAVCLASCSPKSEDVQEGSAPPAPGMPGHWKVVSDKALPPEEVRRIGQNFDAELTAVRNTVYNVNGKAVQLNLFVASDDANTEKVMAKMRAIKGEQGFLRKDLMVYEFFGGNEALPEIAEGRKHLGGDPLDVKTTPAPEMPDGWKVVSNWDRPPAKVKEMSQTLGVKIGKVQNIIFEVDGKRIQLNVATALDDESAEKLMAKLKTTKSEESLLRKGLVVYEFVGADDALPSIAEGRKFLESK